MTIEMDKKNTEPAESPNTALPAAASPAANDLASASFSLGAREEAVLENVISKGNEIVNFQGNGVLNTQTIPEVLSPTPGGASVPVTVIYGTNGSITFENGDLAVEESGTDAGEAVAAPSGPMNYNGDLSTGDNYLGADAGNPKEFTPTIRFVAA